MVENLLKNNNHPPPPPPPPGSDPFISKPVSLVPCADSSSVAVNVWYPVPLV